MQKLNMLATGENLSDIKAAAKNLAAQGVTTKAAALAEAAAKLDAPIINYYFYVVRGRRVFMGFRSDDHSRVRELIPMVKQTASQFPGTIAVVKQSSLFERGLTGGRTIDIEITGPTLEQLVKIGGRVLAEVKRLMPDAQAMPRPSLDLSSPEKKIRRKFDENPVFLQSPKSDVAIGFTM